LSGENGCFQFLGDTWNAFSKEVLGYVAPHTGINEEYVATVKIQKWLEAGKSVEQIALLWNQGHVGKCSRGTNQHGVDYDSCEYAVAVLAYYQQ